MEERFAIYIVWLNFKQCNEYHYERPYAAYTDKEVAIRIKQILEKMPTSELRAKRVTKRYDSASWEDKPIISITPMVVNNNDVLRKLL